MKEKEFFLWLKEEGLADAVEGSYHVFKDIFLECLGIKDEEVLIIADGGLPQRRIAPIMAGCYYLAAKDIGLNAEIVLQEPMFTKCQASKEVAEKATKLKEKSIVILCPSGKAGALGNEISFRKFMHLKKHKFLSAPNLGHLKTEYFYSMLNLMDVDYNVMHRTGNRIKAILDNGRDVHITTRAGTDLWVNIRGMNAINNSGIYWEKGTGGNMPAGEVYIAPNDAKVEGTVVIDGSMKTPSKTYFLMNPVTLTIEKGKVTQIKGGPGAKELQDSLNAVMAHAKHPERVMRIGELGIGTNPKSRMLGPTLINEKTRNTAHIAIGSNHWFGGTNKTIIHLDQVFKDPTIKVDGKTISV